MVQLAISYIVWVAEANFPQASSWVKLMLYIRGSIILDYDPHSRGSGSGPRYRATKCGTSVKINLPIKFSSLRYFLD